MEQHIGEVGRTRIECSQATDEGPGLVTLWSMFDGDELIAIDREFTVYAYTPTQARALGLYLLTAANAAETLTETPQRLPLMQGGPAPRNRGEANDLIAEHYRARLEAERPGRDDAEDANRERGKTR